MRKFYFNGSPSSLSSSLSSNSRSPSPQQYLQILPSHRFQPRQTSKRPSLRYALIIIALLALYSIFQLVPSRTPVKSDMDDDSFLLGEDVPSVRFYDLSQATGTSRGWERNERVLICVPLRDAAPILSLFFSHMRNLTYPHHLMDLAFLVSDSTDQTLQTLLHHLSILQQSPYRFNHALVFEKDFGQGVGQGFSDRHGFEAQGPRRKVMARARNWLLSSGLTAGYNWVYWRDADVETAPATIIEVPPLLILLIPGLDET
jgi:mannan polymerase II complex ANP1 subunit